MNQKELDIYVTKLIGWYEEGCEITFTYDLDEDECEITIINYGVKTYQNFNVYIGKKIQRMYKEAIDEALSNYNEGD